MEDIRNFCIIAHIDHGKSTLADRLIQRCGGVEDRDFRDQILDSMDIERERGITIKSNTITLRYTARDGKTYRLNLIDTPGHVDFSHEVRRSLMSCEGALLLVDASQGVEAQTVANLYLALEYDLEIVPVINKIDLPSADVERIREEIDADLGLDPFEAVLCSAKQGIGIDDVLEAIVTKLPAPKGEAESPLRALIFDAQYDIYRGVVLICRVKEGTLRAGQKILLMHTAKEYEIEEVGLLQLKRVKTASLEPGSVGYIIAGVKAVSEINVGDTITEVDRPAPAPLPGYKEAKPVVFSSIYPDCFRRLRKPRQGARQAQAQRRLADLSERLVDRPGLRFPLRLPRAFAPGNRSGAPGARAQPLAPPLRPLGAVRGDAHQR